MSNEGGAMYGNGYVASAFGKRSHLCVSDRRNYRNSLCGLQFVRANTLWKSVTWEPISQTSRVTCRKCIEVLTGKKNWEEEL